MSGLAHYWLWMIPVGMGSTSFRISLVFFQDSASAVGAPTVYLGTAVNRHTCTTAHTHINPSIPMLGVKGSRMKWSRVQFDWTISLRKFLEFSWACLILKVFSAGLSFLKPSGLNWFKIAGFSWLKSSLGLSSQVASECSSFLCILRFSKSSRAFSSQVALVGSSFICFLAFSRLSRAKWPRWARVF